MRFELNGTLIGGIVLACAAPTAALNIWPRVETMLAKGVSGNEVGIVILVTMSALGMAAIPFAMRKAESTSFWWTCLLTGASLALVNYLMAVGAIGKVRDAHATEAAQVIFKVKTLQSQLADLKAARPSTPPRAVSEEMLQTARDAVQLAIAARDQECGKVGDFCRARVVQLATRQSDLAELTTANAAYRLSEASERRIRVLEDELLRTGPAPLHVDAQAARIAAILGLEKDIERVANYIINLLAVTAEAFALLMPRIIVTALAGPPVQAPTPLKAQPVPMVKSLPAPAGVTDVKKLYVSDWYNQRLRKAQGHRLKTWDAYLDYKRWATEQKLTPVTFPAFSFEMQALKVQEEKVANRSFFLNIDLLARGFRVVA